jgi:hypothetical protein
VSYHTISGSLFLNSSASVVSRFKDPSKNLTCRQQQVLQETSEVFLCAYVSNSQSFQVSDHNQASA